MKKPIIWSYWNHEPIYHLRRMGNDGATVFSLGEWMDEWYDRLHGEELIKKGAALGINTVYCHFYKGSGLLFERKEMQRTKEFTELAHKYGIKVLGYASMGSVYTENITRELPDIKDMLIVNADGKSAPTLCNQYYRPRPCYNSDRYRDYLKSVLKYGIEEIGLDGFHFDNSNTQFCYCDTCRDRFRDYLRENVKNPYGVMGIGDFDYIEIPRLEYKTNPLDTNFICPTGNIHDPLLFWYMKFIRHTLEKFHKEIFDYVKEISDGRALVLQNPGFPRQMRETRSWGFEPMQIPKSCDFVFVENRGGYFGKNYGRTEGQTLAFKYGERFGYKVFDTSWANDNGKLYQFPRNRSAIFGFVMQAAVYGSIAGSPWTVRSMRRGDEVAIDTPYLFDGLKAAFDYFGENYGVFDAASYNRVKILHLPDNQLCADGAFEELCDVARILTNNTVRYSIITEDEIPTLKEGATVILPKILYCTGGLYENLKSASEKGVKIIATCGFGHYNEFTKGRCEDSEIFNLKGISGAVLTDKESLPSHIDKSLTVDTDAVLLETRLTSDGSLILHILNADAERELGEVTVTLCEELLRGMRVAKVLTPDGSTATAVIDGIVATVKIKDLLNLVSIVFEEQKQ